MAKIQCKRVFDTYSEEDGIRILVDRLWPRGLSKEKAKLDYWLKEVAPTHELRKWYHQNLDEFEEFKIRYEAELTQDKQKEAIEQLIELVVGNDGPVTLLYGAKNEENNQAVILKQILEGK
ncbi:DUF488 domain-containing protein [Paucisalibacillus sp. EB02]|uniref:DUF488 domain-containing protein n=1 Tax=Paucisalibacillus sp. EB02 TaxID=1347087 RepID=UPI0004BBC798|nr:DUF488 family protein [Paucisalibacillus sp. EB02]